MTNRELVLTYLRSVSPRAATNRDIQETMGIDQRWVQDTFVMVGSPIGQASQREADSAVHRRAPATRAVEKAKAVARREVVCPSWQLWTEASLAGGSLLGDDQ
jgi:hypothetical protein